MSYFLALQHASNNYEVALFDDTLLDIFTEPKTNVSKNIILAIDNLLQENKLTLSELEFIAVNQGPGPFTTLRAIITTANGIAFASHIPLIGINSLSALLAEHADQKWPHTIALLNAYTHDVYYGIQQNNKPVIIGCENIEQFLEKMSSTKHVLRFLGNGTELFKNLIKQKLGDYAYIPEPLPLDCSLTQIAQMAREQWHQKENLSEQLLPIYLKNMNYKQAIKHG